jgi:hypothetical protein
MPFDWPRIIALDLDAALRHPLVAIAAPRARIRIIVSTSYCITVYNKARHIGRVVDAVIAEAARIGGEIVVYDDGSTDESVALLRPYVERGAVRLIEGRENVGVFAATERLIREARQPFLRLVDGDDEIVAGSTAKLIAALERHDAVLAIGGCMARTEAVSAVETESSALVPEAFALYAKNVDFNLSGAVMRTGSAKTILPLPTGLRISQDLCITLRLARRGAVARSAAVASIQPDEPDNRLSRRVAAMFRDICLILSIELGAESPPAEAAAVTRRQAGRCLRYFRREAPASLTLPDRLALYRYRLTSPTCPVPTSQTRLRRIAGIYAGDAERVLKHAG